MVRDLIDEMTPGSINVGNVSELALLLAAIYFFQTGTIQLNGFLMLAGAAVGSGALVDASKKKRA